MLPSLSSDVEQLLIACAETEVDNLESQLVIILGSALLDYTMSTCGERGGEGAQYFHLHKKVQTDSCLRERGRFIIFRSLPYNVEVKKTPRVPSWPTQG
jgi:hypothetical protein